MRLLKFFLWIILLACIVWGAAIFMGPAVISRVVAASFGDAVKVQRLNVSPALEVSAAAVEFDFPSRDGVPAVRGISRGVSLNWGITDSIRIDLRLGPTRVEEFGAVASVAILLTPKSYFDWSYVKLQGDFRKAIAAQHSAELGHFSAELETGSQLATEVQVEAEKITASIFGFEVPIPKAMMKLSDIEFGAAIAGQASDLEVQFPEGFTVDGADLKLAVMQGRLEGGVIDFDVTGSEFSVSTAGVGVSKLNGSGAFDLRRQVFRPEIEFGLEDIALEVPYASIKSYAGKITHQDGVFVHLGLGNIEKFVIGSNKNFIGELSDAAFKLEVSALTKEPGLAQLQGIANIEIADNFNFAATLDAAVESRMPIYCLSSECNITEVTAKYVARVPGAQLVGSSFCPKPACGFGSYNHTIQTDNTDKFFEGVIASRVFTPLAVPIAYAAVRRGSAIGNGHRLDF
jgi:hypothetical protein